MVSLVRWVNHFEEVIALLHPVEATENLRFRGVRYDLCAVVVHLGDSPNSGHYMIVARHRTGDAETPGIAHHWWLYDDSRRVMATPEQVATTCNYQGWKTMQSYVLLYELAD